MTAHNIAHKMKAPFRIFDTHKEVENLIKSGVKKKEAESIVNLVATSTAANLADLATKEQVHRLEEDMKGVKAEVKDIREEIKTYNRWIIGMMIAILGLLIKLAIK